MLVSDLIGAMIASLVGAGIAFLNYSLTRKAIRKTEGGIGALGAAPVLRMVIDVGYLAAVYFIAPFTPWDRIWMLVGAVIGLTVPLLFFTPRLLRDANRSAADGGRQKDDPPEGGDV